MKITRIGGTSTIPEAARTFTNRNRIVNVGRPASLFSLSSPLCCMVVENPLLPSIRKDIIETVKKHNTGADLAVIEKAIDLASDFHSGQVFIDGEPVIYHQCRIAKQLADWKLPPESVAAGVLTAGPASAIERLADRRVSELLNKKSSLESFKFNVQKIGHRKKFMKFALMKEADPLVHLLIAAREYHTMLKGTEEAPGIAAHAFYVTAPFLTLVGVTDAGRELENMAFFHISPEVANRAKSIFEERTSMDRVKALEELKIICAQIENDLLLNGIVARIVPDTKMEASLSKKDSAGDDLTDLIRFRILVNTVEECYRAYELVKEELVGKSGLGFTRIKKGFTDFIADPKKENNYQSIHDHFRDKTSGYSLAVQIRTHAMHVEAEYGRASHWKYKRQSQFGKLPDFTLAPEAVAQNIRLLREALAKEKRTYAFDQKGELQRLGQASDKPVTFWDLAVQGDVEAGPFCPAFVEVERFNADGKKVNLKLSRNNQVENGDRLLPLTEKARKIGNPDNLGTNLSALIVKQKKMGARLETMSAAEIEEKGEAKCNAVCAPSIEEIKVLAGEIITLPDLEILYSKERVAKKMGFRSVDDFHCAFALYKGRDLSQLIEGAAAVMRDSFVALAYDGEKQNLWLLTRGRRGVLVSTGKIFEQQKLQVSAAQLLFLEDKELVLMRFDLSEPVKDRKKLNQNLRELYQTVSDTRTTYDLTQHLLLTFNIRRMTPDNIIEAINRVLEAEVAVKKMQIEPIARDRGKALFTLNIPAGRNIKAATDKIKKLLSRNALFNGVSLHEERELLPQ